MRFLRGLAGALLWILAALIGLVGALLCVTIVLLPLGIPLLGAARRMFTQSVRLMLPPSVAHPVKTARHSALRGVATAWRPPRPRPPERSRSAAAPGGPSGSVAGRYDPDFQELLSATGRTTRTSSTAALRTVQLDPSVLEDSDGGLWSRSSTPASRWPSRSASRSSGRPSTIRRRKCSGGSRSGPGARTPASPGAGAPGVRAAEAPSTSQVVRPAACPAVRGRCSGPRW